MSAIFISHSSNESSVAARIREGLRAREYRSLFLDFDPADGIPAGRDWESELFTHLAACQAVVVLCSRHSMESRWVFAEVAYARAEGKEIVPIKVADCAVDRRLERHQIIDATTTPWPEVLERLVHGLETAGLGPGHYDPDRPPYPGLRPFEEEDAAVFFGRSDQIRDLQNRLNRAVDLDLARLLMVVGASGSGKSSLVRAGLVPRLRRNESSWVVVDPFRPGADPVGSLAEVLAQRFAAFHTDQPATVIKDELVREGNSSGSSGLVKITDRLLGSAGQPNATLVLVIDQFEELLGQPPSEPARRFAEILRRTLDAGDCPFIAIGTLRSDRFPDFQHVNLPFNDFPLGPMQREGFRQVIEGPAALAGIKLEDGLVDTILVETEESKTPDALPLLAFALHELWRDFGEDKLLEKREYRDLGGLEGCIARAAEDLLKARRKPGSRQLVLSPESERELRTAFGRMVEVDEEGRLTRVAVEPASLPQGVRPLIDSFVEKRLLRRRAAGPEDDTPVVEAAHEALFRSWTRLEEWIKQDREFLQWRERTGRAAAQWEDKGYDEEALLRGRLLREAQEWFNEQPTAIETGKKEYIEASVRAERGRRRRDVLRRVAAVAASILIATAAIVVWRMGIQQAAQQELNRAEGILASVEARAPDADPLGKALLLVELSDDPQDREPEGGLTTALELIQNPIPWLLLDVDGSEVSAAALSPDGSLAVTGDMDGSVRIWLLDSFQEPTELPGHRGRIRSIEFSKDGQSFVTASDDSTARVWQADSSSSLLLLAGHTGRVRSAVFDSSGVRVVTASDDSTARIWPLDGVAVAPVLSRHRAGVRSAWFSPDGSRVVTASDDSTARVWSAYTGESLEVMSGHVDKVSRAQFSPDGKRVLTASRDNTAGLWNLDNPSNPRMLEGHHGPVWGAEFSPKGTWIATVSADDTVRVWPGDGSGPPRKLVGHTEAVWTAQFSSDELYLVTTSADGTTRIWNVGDSTPISALRHEPRSDVRTAVFSANGRRLLTTSSRGPPRVWRSNPGLLATLPSMVFQSPDATPLDWQSDPSLLGQHAAGVQSVDISPNGMWVASASIDSTVRVWPLAGAAERTVPVPHGDLVYDARFSSRGTRIVTASEDGVARVWDVTRPDRVDSLVGHRMGVRTAVFSPDGGRVITGSHDGTARIWSADGHASTTLLGHQDWVRALVVPHDSRVVTYSGDGLVLVHKRDGLGEPTRLDSVAARITTAGVSRDGRRLAVGALDGRVWIWDLQRPGEADLLLGHQGTVNSVSFSADGNRVVTASEDHTARIWKILSDDRPIMLSGHQGPVNSAFFDPHDSTVVTASDDSTARIWSDDGGAAKTTIRGHAGAVVEARWGPDGGYVVSGSKDGTVRVWDLTLSRIVRYIRGRTRACLSPDDRQRLLGEVPTDANAAAEECQQRQRQSAESDVNVP